MRQLDLCLELPGDEHELLVFPSALAPAGALEGPTLWCDGLERDLAWHVVGRHFTADGGRRLAHGVVPLLQARLRRLEAGRAWSRYVVKGHLLFACPEEGRSVVLVMSDRSFLHVDVLVRAESTAVAMRQMDEVECILREAAQPAQLVPAPLDAARLYESGECFANPADTAGRFFAIIKPWSLASLPDPPRPGRFDVFVSHAGTDKWLVVELYLFLSALGLECFYDQVSITDRIWQNIAAGVRDSHLLVAALSESFFDSARSLWPQQEGVTMCDRRAEGGGLAVYPVFLCDYKAVKAMGGVVARADGSVRHGRDDQSLLTSGHLLGGDMQGCILENGCLSVANLSKTLTNLCERAEVLGLSLRVDTQAVMAVTGGRLAEVEARQACCVDGSQTQFDTLWLQQRIECLRARFSLASAR